MEGAAKALEEQWEKAFTHIAVPPEPPNFPLTNLVAGGVKAKGQVVRRASAVVPNGPAGPVALAVAAAHAAEKSVTAAVGGKTAPAVDKPVGGAGAKAATIKSTPSVQTTEPGKKSGLLSSFSIKKEKAG